jgi:hypothetical protein
MHFGRFATRADSDANRELALRSGIARAQADPRKGHHFQGVERSAEFDSRCDSSGGWAEPCRIVLMLQSLRGGADSTRVILIAVPELTSLGRDSAQLFECAGNGVLRYYDPLRELWLPTWMDGITAPAAIALIAESDTIVFNIMGH